MADCSEVFVGLDTSKLRNAVAIAEGGRNGEVRYLGEIENTEAATNKLVKKLAAQHRRRAAGERGATFPSVATAQVADLHLGMTLLNQMHLTNQPTCNGPVHLSMITWGVTADVSGGKTIRGVHR
jgi:hypothetical protein